MTVHKWEEVAPRGKKIKPYLGENLFLKFQSGKWLIVAENDHPADLEVGDNCRIRLAHGGKTCAAIFGLCEFGDDIEPIPCF